MANIYFTDHAKGIEKQFIKTCTEDEATEFCLRPANQYNYVSKRGYRMEKQEPDLPAFKITRDDGTHYTTSMAAGITLADARAYFLGQVQVEENFETGAETRRTVVKVERVLEDTPELRTKRAEAYLKGEYRFNPPPVTTAGWSDEAWCNWVFFNDDSLTGFLPYRTT